VAVLQEVDVDAAAAVSREPDRGRDLGQPARHHAREQLAELLALLEGALPPERNQHVEARRARVLA